MLASFRNAIALRSNPGLDGEWLSDGSSWLAMQQPGVALGLMAPNMADISALSISAFYGGVRTKSTLVATMPMQAIDGKVAMETVPDIIEQPDPDEHRNVTIMRLVTSMMLRGNGFALLGARDELGYPHAMRVVHPDQVGVRMTPEGRWIYVVAGKDTSPSDVLHVRGLTLAGEPLGLSVIGAHRRLLDREIRAEEFQRISYRDNHTPTALLIVDDDDISPEAEDAIKARYLAGMRGNREPVVVPGNIEYKPLTLNNQDMQFLESRQFSLTEVANIVGLPKNYLNADTTGLKYDSPEMARRDLLDIYMTWEIAEIEAAFTKLLPPGMSAHLDGDELTRNNRKERAEALKVEGGWKTLNQIRESEGLDPVEGGDVIAEHYVPTDGPGADDDLAHSKEIGEFIRDIFPSVQGPFIRPEEAREMLKKLGMPISGPAPEPEPEPTAAVAEEKPTTKETDSTEEETTDDDD